MIARYEASDQVAVNLHTSRWAAGRLTSSGVRIAAVTTEQLMENIQLQRKLKCLVGISQLLCFFYISK